VPVGVEALFSCPESPVLPRWRLGRYFGAFLRSQFSRRGCLELQLDALKKAGCKQVFHGQSTRHPARTQRLGRSLVAPEVRPIISANGFQSKIAGEASSPPFPPLLVIHIGTATPTDPSITVLILLAWVPGPRELDAGALHHRGQTQFACPSPNTWSAASQTPPSEVPARRSANAF
jgi:hypothetical protein